MSWTKAEYDQCPELADRLHREILTLRDRERRLREALREIARIDSIRTGPPYRHVEQVARDALADPAPEEAG